MIETLFVVNPISKLNQTTPRSDLPLPNQENRVLDPKKAQNIAILLKALNVTVEEVSEALLEGTKWQYKMICILKCMVQSFISMVIYR